MKAIRVNEIFYSIQGEGIRAGTANIFIRLAGCSTKYACFRSGVLCDTEFESGDMMNTEDISNAIGEYDCRNIIWTGGEPFDQLTTEHVKYFHDLGYFQAAETSGLREPPEGLDFICISPKVAEHVINNNFGQCETEIELRYVRHKGQSIPKPTIKAKHYCISPHTDGAMINDENLVHCIELVKQNPDWRLSVQQHKIWHIL